MINIFYKALGYRVAASVFTIGIAWFVTGSLSVGATVGAIEFVAKLAGYVAFELFWNEATEPRADRYADNRTGRMLDTG